MSHAWAEVLGLSQVGIDDNFFELGGDSIRTIQVLAKVKNHGFTFPVQQLFQHQTIRELAGHLQREETGARFADQPFSMLPPEDKARMPEGVEDAYPLAMLQAGMIFHSHFSPDSTEYHNVSSFHIRARLEVETLRAAIARLITRHPVLRTSFDLTTFSQPLQLVHEVVDAPLGVDDLTALSPAQQEEAIGIWVEAERHRHFDLARAPLLRFHVHRRSDSTFQFAMTEHHAILDGWSVACVLSEIFQTYVAMLGGETSEAEPPPSALFREFIALEREALESEDCRRYWRAHLSDFNTLMLPRYPTYGRENNPTRNHDVAAPISKEVSIAIKELAASMHVPLKTVLLAVHLRVLGLIVGELDITTGVVGHGRPERADGARTLGLFLNSLPLRMKMDAGTWADLIRKTFDVEQEQLSRQYYPMAQMQIDNAGKQLFEALFNFTNFHVLAAVEQSSEIQVLNENSFIETNLTMSAEFSLDLSSSQVRLRLTANPTELCREQLEVWSGYYGRALSAIAQDPNASYMQVGLLSDREIESTACRVERHGARL